MKENNALTPDPMAPLREKYLAILRERRPGFQEFADRCLSGQATAEDFRTASERAHKLAGSGKTYGFADISHTGRVLEDALDAGMTDQRQLAEMMHRVLSACDAALALEAEPAPAIPPSAFAPHPSKNGMTLLIADDDPAICDLVMMLFAHDARVIVARDGREALTMIRRDRPDLVLLDDVMPEMSGMKLLEILQQDEELSHIPVIMLTASRHPQDVMHGVAAGALDYITKPFEPSALAARVREMLAHSGMTILVADDDDTVRELVAHKLHLAGFHILQAADGEQALTLAREQRPQLLVLDRMMPGIDGLAVLQLLHAEEATRHIPVLFLTAKRHEKDILEGFRQGAVDYIVKPFIPDELVARVMRILGADGRAHV